MKRLIIRYFSVFVIFVCSFGICLSWAASPPQKGGMLPEINLPVPKNPAHRAYLGLSEGKDFKIPQIKADVVIIEILNVY